MDLKDILDEVKSARKKASIDMTKVSESTIQMQKGRKKSAELRLPYLERDYKLALARHLAVFVVTGTESSEFGKLASEITKEESLDAEGLYKEILNRMPKEATTGKMAPKVIVDIMNRHLLEMADELEIASFPFPTYKHSKGFAVNNKEDLFRLIKRTLNSSDGATMAAAFVLKQAAKQALKNEFDGDLYPVVATLGDDSIADEIVSGFNNIFGQTNLLTAGKVENKIETKVFQNVEEVNEKSVMVALKAVKQKLTKNGRKTSTKKTTENEETEE